MKLFGIKIGRDAPAKKSAVTSKDLEGVLEEMVVGGAGAAGVHVTTTTAMRHGAVYACIKYLMQSVGVLPLEVFDRDGEKWVKRPDSDWQRLLDNPNSFQTGLEFWEMCVGHLKLQGNFYAYADSFNGRVRKLVPFGMGAVTPKLREGTNTVVFECLFPDGTTDVLGADEVLHIKGPSTDGLVGLSDIGQARETIGLSIATELHGNRLFKNGAQTPGALETDEVLEEETYERIRKSWTDTHEGVDNAGKTAILEAGLKYKSLTMTNDDAQFLETRKFQRSEICGIFGVPPHKIGDLERATFSNIEHQNQQFVDDTLLPLVMRIEARLNLMMPKGRKVKFNLKERLRGDVKTRGQYYHKMIQNGVYSPNDVREKEGENPREGGDVYLTPTNMLHDGKLPDDAKDDSQALPSEGSEI